MRRIVIRRHRTHVWKTLEYVFGRNSTEYSSEKAVYLVKFCGRVIAFTESGTHIATGPNKRGGNALVLDDKLLLLYNLL